jgi:hypothetical protein
MKPRTISIILLAVICALGGASVMAQQMFKSTMPDGRVIFGDKPVDGAAKVEPIKPDTAKRGIQTLTPGEAAAAKQAEQERLKRESAADTVRAAEQALRDAETALAKGEEPLPGERIGTAGGTSRLTDAYWKRQQQLKDDVGRARAALEKARAPSR